MVDDQLFSIMTRHELRVLAVQLGVLVQDNPEVDVLKSRIRHCKAV